MKLRKYTYRTPEGPRTTVQLSTEQLVELMMGTARGRQAFQMLAMPQHSPSQRHRRRKRLMVKMCLAMVEAMLEELIGNGNRLVMPGAKSSIYAARLPKGMVRLAYRLDTEMGSRHFRQFFRSGHSIRVTPCTGWFERMIENSKKLKYRQL